MAEVTPRKLLGVEVVAVPFKVVMEVTKSDNNPYVCQYCEFVHAKHRRLASDPDRIDTFAACPREICSTDVFISVQRYAVYRMAGIIEKVSNHE